jgi:hypothetical protein
MGISGKCQTVSCMTLYIDGMVLSSPDLSTHMVYSRMQNSVGNSVLPRGQLAFRGIIENSSCCARSLIQSLSQSVSQSVWQFRRDGVPLSPSCTWKIKIHPSYAMLCYAMLCASLASKRNLPTRQRILECLSLILTSSTRGFPSPVFLKCPSIWTAN